jgi:alkylation response protein AidB-like acyl-CoA dehydrogenase
VIVDVQNTLVNNALLRWGNEEQKKRYLPKLAKPTRSAPTRSARPAPAPMPSRCRPAPSSRADYVLNGRKLWITNGKEAGSSSCSPRRSRAGLQGHHRVPVEKDFPGFTVGKKEDKLGIRASSTCELILEDCRVPKENVLGEVGKGYKIAIETLNEGRIGIGAQMVGVARGAWEFA